MNSILPLGRFAVMTCPSLSTLDLDDCGLDLGGEEKVVGGFAPQVQIRVDGEGLQQTAAGRNDLGLNDAVSHLFSTLAFRVDTCDKGLNIVSLPCLLNDIRAVLQAIAVDRLRFLGHLRRPRTDGKSR